MKKVSKAIVCTILILLVLLGFVAKYWANGIYPGHAGGQILYLEISQKTGAETAMGGSSTCVFTNAFGRTVVAYSLIPTDPNSVWGKLHSKFGNVVTQVQVIPTTFTVTTHLDFFNMYRKDGCFFTPLIARAGKPLDAKNTAFCYQTIDGYTYYVQGTIGGGAYLQAIYDPQGTLLNDDQVRALTTNVLLINLSIAAVLSVVLVLLIKIPNNIRKRKVAVQGD